MATKTSESKTKKVFDLIKQREVKYVDFRFTDPRGKWQHTAQPVHTIDDSTFVDGVMFDGSSIAGWKDISASDMCLMPDPDTITIDPFAAQTQAILFCDTIEPTTGQASGVRVHAPLTIVKLIDAASPGFHKATCTGQNLAEVKLDFYRIDPATRQEEKYYTITLKQARIVDVRPYMPMSFLPQNEPYRHMEKVSFVYEEVEWNWIPDSKIEMDKWRAPGAA